MSTCWAGGCCCSSAAADSCSSSANDSWPWLLLDEKPLVEVVDWAQGVLMVELARERDVDEFFANLHAAQQQREAAIQLGSKDRE
jgi:hypothetical protein